MRIVSGVVVLFSIASAALAAPYGAYDMQRVVTVSGTGAAEKRAIDAIYLDKILNDLAGHAQEYPPRFDSATDRARAVADVRALQPLLDSALGVAKPPPELLLRAALLNSIGHNLDISGSAERADALFKQLLAVAPDHRRGNYLYGSFLAGAGKPQDALPFLERALAAGEVDAAYALGTAYLQLGNKTKAIEQLEAYLRKRPDDKGAVQLLEAVRAGKVKMKSTAD